MIEVRDLVKQYGNRLAVDHLSFTVPDGQIFGFLGPNGAGKSTTMNLMTGYLGPTSGEILVDGFSVTKEPEKAKRQIGYLPELPPLYMDMTVDEYLRFAAQLKKVPKKEREPQIDRVAEMTGVDQVLGRLIRNLSKGYRQRVGLAQALLGFPKVLILDEPTVGLDPKQILEMRTLIRQLAREHTVILSSHILSEVQEVCDHLLIIHHGKKVAAGEPEELERSLSGNPALEIVVRGEGELVRSQLALLSGMTSLTQHDCREAGCCAFRLECAPGEDLREAVFQTCAQEGLPLLELRQDTMTLEDIFLKLTSDDVEQEPENPASAQPGGASQVQLSEADQAKLGEDIPVQLDEAEPEKPEEEEQP